MRVILLRDFDFREQAAIQLQSCGKVVESLFEVTILKVGFSQFGISCYKNEKVFLVDVHEQFT